MSQDYIFPDSSPSDFDGTSWSPLDDLADETGSLSSSSFSLTPQSSIPKSNIQRAQRMTEGLAIRFQSSEEQRKELLALNQMGMSLGVPLGDSMQRVFLLACRHASERRIIAASAVPRSDSGNTSELVNELSIRFEDSWQITTEQKINTQLVCQELVYKPKRMEFKSLHTAVIAKICEKPEKYRLENVVNRPSRKKKWEKVAKRLASDARNSLRQQIRDSVYGDRRCTLEQYTKDQAGRYRSTSTEDSHLIQNVILRRFVRENPTVLDRDEDEDETGTTETTVDETGQVLKKRKQTKGRGRIAEGDDFWGKVDIWFTEKKRDWGEEYSSSSWKIYIKESFRQDWEEFAPKKSQSPQPFSSITVSNTHLVAGPSSVNTLRNPSAAAIVSPDDVDWMKDLINDSA